jgi:hypothetical protein
MKNRFLKTLAVYIPVVIGFFLLCRSSNVSAHALQQDFNRNGDGTYRWIQVRFAADYWMTFRNENPEELKSVLLQADSEGGFPVWIKEYGRHLLESCGKNAILFTGSMTDTIGAWYCQAVQKFRRDVVVLPVGMLDRDWFVDAMDHRNAFLGKTGRKTDPISLERLNVPDSYARSNLLAFLRILRMRRADRSVYLSMDVNSGFLKAVQDRLALSGCVFRLHPHPSKPGDPGIDLDATLRLFSEPRGFDAIRNQNHPSIPEVDTVRNHYRFAATRLLNSTPTAGRTLKEKLTEEWIRDAFHNALLPAPEGSKSVEDGADAKASAAAKGD